MHLKRWTHLLIQSASPELYRAKVKQSELILFTTQLSVMLDSGVVLSDALDAIAEQAEHGTFKIIIMDVAGKVKAGDDFSKSLAGYSKVFNTMFVSMVKASEASGNAQRAQRLSKLRI
ncbi:type II secretion system F family protein [Planctomycetota bacterium]